MIVVSREGETLKAVITSSNFPQKGDKGLVELFYTAYADLSTLYGRPVTQAD